MLGRKSLKWAAAMVIVLVTAGIAGLTSTAGYAGDGKVKADDEDAYRVGRFPVYTANIDTYETEVSTYLEVPESLTVEEKLQVIARKLSSDYFGKLPIELEKIEKRYGKKIAVINLRESSENQGVTNPLEMEGDTWAVLYFQGSCQGAITSTTLIESFLQRGYTGEWIDGVRFLYNGKSMEAVDAEHAPALYSITYR
jgi:hypothetical protein